MPKVYIPNRSFHDFTPAEAFGELVFLTEGWANRTLTNQLYRMVSEAMRDSQPDDMLLVSSLGILNAIAASILAVKHKRVNYLIHVKGGYVLREIVLDGLEREMEKGK